jgi:adenosylhomocysteine nucleosidase
MPLKSPSASLISGLLKEHPLYIFALETEATHEFSGLGPHFVGVGKVNATYRLVKKIHENKPDIIVNLGSAGSNQFRRGEIICCTQFIQRDMDVRALGFEKYKTPFSQQEPILRYGLKVDDLPEGICGSGDSFEIAHETEDYNVIDMEAYPIAWVAMQEQIPFLCLKYISDGADGSAAEEWQVSVHHAASALREVIGRLYDYK